MEQQKRQESRRAHRLDVLDRDHGCENPCKTKQYKHITNQTATWNHSLHLLLWQPACQSLREWAQNSVVWQAHFELDRSKKGCQDLETYPDSHEAESLRTSHVLKVIAILSCYAMPERQTFEIQVEKPDKSILQSRTLESRKYRVQLRKT